MGETNTIFRVEKDLEEKIKNKYSNFRINGTEFDFGPTKIQLQSKIYEEYLGTSEDETKKVFKELCTAFVQTCYESKIRLDPLNILVLTDDEINRGFQATIQKEDGTLCGLIFISPAYLKIYGFWIYTFLHELGHCWLSIERPKADSPTLPNYEMFVDLIAICTLNKIIPSHKKLFRDILKHCSYVREEKYFGKQLQKRILENPESVLKEFLETRALKGGDP